MKLEPGSPPKLRLIVGVSGASDAIYGVRLLDLVGRVLDLLDIDMGPVRRWTGDKARPKEAGQKEPVRGQD